MTCAELQQQRDQINALIDANNALLQVQTAQVAATQQTLSTLYGQLGYIGYQMQQQGCA